MAIISIIFDTEAKTMTTTRDGEVISENGCTSFSSTDMTMMSDMSIKELIGLHGGEKGITWVGKLSS